MTEEEPTAGQALDARLKRQSKTLYEARTATARLEGIAGNQAQQLDSLRAETEELRNKLRLLDTSPASTWDGVSNLGQTPDAWALPFLHRESENVIRVNATASSLSQVELLEQAQEWFRPWNAAGPASGPEDATYCVGVLVFEGARYYLDRPWVVLGRLQLEGQNLQHGGTQFVWDGGNRESETMLSVLDANEKQANGNFCADWSGFSVICKGRVQGLRWGSANWGKLSSIYVEDPAAHGRGIVVARGTNSPIIENCFVMGPGGGEPPREGTTGIEFEAGSNGTVIGGRYEQQDRGILQRTNTVVDLVGVETEACNVDIITQNQETGGTHGTLRTFANHTGQLVRVDSWDHRGLELAGWVAETRSPHWTQGGSHNYDIDAQKRGYTPFQITT